MVQVYADLPQIVFTEAGHPPEAAEILKGSEQAQGKHPKEKSIIWLFSAVSLFCFPSY